MLLLTPAAIGWPPRLGVKKLTGIEAKIVPDLKMRQRVCTEAECNAETMAHDAGISLRRFAAAQTLHRVI
jgi:hypothetical protein